MQYVQSGHLELEQLASMKRILAAIDEKTVRSEVSLTLHMCYGDVVAGVCGDGDGGLVIAVTAMW